MNIPFHFFPFDNISCFCNSSWKVNIERFRVTPFDPLDFYLVSHNIWLQIANIMIFYITFNSINTINN